MLLFQEVPALPSRPTLLFATSCFLSQPQQPFPPSEQIQAIVSACAKWRRGGKGPVGLGQMLRGWNFLKCIGCQQWDAFCRSNKVICVSSSFTLLKAANPEMFNQPLVVPSPPKYERQNCWQEEKRREFMSFYKLVWAMRTLPALLGVRSRSLWSKLFSCPDLSAWESLHTSERRALSPAL